MAQTYLQDVQLRLVLEAGLDGDGKMQYKSKNYNNIKPSVTPDQLFAVAQAIASLQTLPLNTIEKNDSFVLGV
ncbi:DUF1659 domain-containing protein [Cytobacillus suaedae]|nr:DUF1659 domain-containing protein [Cytobacillus suaedae]